MGERRQFSTGVMMTHITLHKARATRLAALLALSGIRVSHSHTLQAIAAAHNHVWAALLRDPDLPVLPEAEARTAVAARLRHLGHTVSTNDIPADVVGVMPTVSAAAALQGLLPPLWADLALPPFQKAVFDQGRQMQLRLLDGSEAAFGEELITPAHRQHLIDALGGLRDGRGGVPGSCLAVAAETDQVTIFANHDHPGVARTLRAALDGHVVVLCPGFDPPGPRLRDIVRHGWAMGCDVHTVEWSGGISGAAMVTGLELPGIHRHVADDTLAQLKAVQPHAVQPTLVVIETALLSGQSGYEQREAQALVELAARGVQIVAGVYARDREIFDREPLGRLIGGAWQPTVWTPDQLPAWVPPGP